MAKLMMMGLIVFKSENQTLLVPQLQLADKKINKMADSPATIVFYRIQSITYIICARNNFLLKCIHLCKE